MDRRLAAFGVLGVGFFIAGSIILGVVGGHWLDGRLNSEPLFLIIGLLLGIVVAFYGVYAMLRPFLKDKQDKGNS
jgi:ATP synthase protein I